MSCNVLTIFHCIIMILIVVFFTLFLHLSKCSRLLISEINSDCPLGAGNEFIELRLTGPAPSGNYSLDGYFLLIVKPEETFVSRFGNSRIVLPRFSFYANLSASWIKAGQSYFTIGDSNISPDLDFYSAQIIARTKTTKIVSKIENGNKQPLAIILIKTANKKFVHSFIEERVDLLNKTTNFIKSNLVDMTVYARRAPFDHCALFQNFYPGNSINSDYVLRELDHEGFSDFSLNKCPSVDDCCAEKPFYAKSFKLGRPTPGSSNDCTGFTFNFTNYLINTSRVFSTDTKGCISKYYPLYKQGISSQNISKKISSLYFQQRNKTNGTNLLFTQCPRDCTAPKQLYIPQSKKRCLQQDSNNNNNCEESEYNDNEASNVAILETTPSTIKINDRHCFMANVENNKHPTTCGTTEENKHLFALSEIAENKISESVMLVGIENEADAVLSRGDAIFDWKEQNLQNMFVCKKHLDELGHKLEFLNLKRRFGSNYGYKCDFAGVEGSAAHDITTAAQRNLFLTKEEAKALFVLKKTLLPVGLPLCKKHYDFVKDILAEYRVYGKGYCLRPHSSKSFAESPVLQSRLPLLLSQPKSEASDYCPSELSEDSQSFRSKMELLSFQEKIHYAIEEAGISNLWASENFGRLSSETKLRRARAVKLLLKKIIYALAPDSPKELETMVGLGSVQNRWLYSDSDKLRKIMEVISTCYLDATSSIAKLQCLSIITPFINFAQLQQYLPGISDYYFKQSRLYAKKYGCGAHLNKEAQQRIKYDERKVVSFLFFITSPHIVIDLPYGIKKAKTSGGKIEEIPNLIRMMINERIVEQYSKFLAENNEQHLMMSRSSLLRILKYCPASTRKAIQGMDYFTYAGTEAFDTLMAVVEQIGEQLPSGTEWSFNVLQRLKEGKQYIKADYKLHLKLASKIPDHCMTYALSDPANMALAESCDHAHHLYCSSCEQIKDVMFDIERKLTLLDINKKKKDEIMFQMKNAKEAIIDWKQHQVRVVNQERARIDLFNNMRDDDVFITVDWAMKFIPKSGREDQTAWFGKKGIPWHITVVHHRNSHGVFQKRIFVHVFDPSPQDASAVTAIINDTLSRIKQELPHIKQAFIRSDNAGCYHGSQTIATMPRISQETGIHIKRWDFSDPQAGKGACDRMAAVIKRKVKLFIDENNHCTDAAELVRCISSRNGVKGTTVVYGHINTITTSTVKTKLPGIAGYNNFEFEAEAIRAWRAYKIGVGVLFLQNSLWLGKISTSSLVAKQVFHEGILSTTNPTTSLWLAIVDAQVSKPFDPVAHPTEQGQVSFTDTKSELYPCPEDNCIKSYQKLSSLLNHIELGKHMYKPERKTLRDVAIHAYKQQLEERLTNPGIPVLQDLLQELWNLQPEDPEHTPLTTGWALRTRKSCKKFTQRQVSYLQEKFDDGIRNRKKLDARKVAQEMQEASFGPSEYLTWHQISNFWSREAQKRERLESSAFQQTDATGATEMEEMDCLNEISQVDENVEDEDMVENLQHELQQTECFEYD